MKSKLLLINIFVLLLSGSVSFAQEIKWYNWDEGYEKAKKEKKVILLDAFTDWCYWCKVMDQNTYSDEDIVKKVKKDFVAIKLNPEKELNYTFMDNKYSGRELIVKLSEDKFRGYPTTFFVNPNTGTSVMVVGYLEVAEFSPVLDTNKSLQ